MIDHEDTPDLFSGPRAVTTPDVGATAASTIGARLRRARAAKALSIAECATRVHLPVKVLERLEGDDFGEPEHFVFLRGALQGYARFLGLPPGSCDQALRSAAPPEQPALVSVARTSPMRWLLQRYGTAATYIVLTAMIAVPLVWLGLRGGLEPPATRIVSLDQVPTVAHSKQARQVPPATASATTSPDEAPFRASMTPFAAIGLTDSGSPAKPAPEVAESATGQHTLTVSAEADCWYEIIDANGDKVDSGILHAGASRTWHADGALHVTLGNVDGVTVTSDGTPVPLDQYRRANVAHFDVFAANSGGGEND